MTRRTTVVAFAVIASLLLATTPTAVSAQSSELVVGSQHTTTSDFDNARELTNLTAENDQVILTGDTTIDDVEDGDITEYGGSTGFYDANSSHALAGSHSIRGQTDGSSPTSIASTSGLPAYPSPGDTFRVRFQSENIFESGVSSSFFGIGWAAQSDSAFPDGYETHITGDGTFSIHERNASGPVEVNSTSIALSNDQEYEFGVEWNTSGQMTVTVYEDTTGNGEFLTTVATLSMTDNTFTSGGISIGLNSNGPDRVAFVDEWRLTPGPPDRGVYRSQYHQVDNVEQAAVNISDLSNASAKITIEDGDANQLAQTTVTSPANHSVSLTTASQTNSSVLVNVTVQNQTTNGEPAFTLSDEAILFTNHAPSVDNSSASPTGRLSGRNNTFEIDVSDRELPTVQGDQVEATLYVDGTAVGSDTLTSNGTASVTHSLSTGGEHSYVWQTEDSYGLTQNSSEQTVSVPGTLFIRNESNASQFVDGTTRIEAVFYTTDGEQAIEKNTTNGTIDLAGLPTGQEFVVTISADGWFDRRVHLDSLFQQENAFLLNQTVHSDAVNVQFSIDDKTGEFPQDETVLKIQRALPDPDTGGNVTWRTVAGDYFGASGTFPFTGAYQVRYRLVVENADGDTRVLGSYHPEADETATLTIGRILVEPPEADSYIADAWVETSDTGNKTLFFTYRDPENQTSDLAVEIYNRSNTSDVLYADSTTSTLGNYTVSQPLTGDDANTSWVVNWSATRNSDAVSGKIPVNSQSTPLPLAEQWLHTFSLIFIVVVAALYSDRIASIGALVTVALAGVLMLLGWATILEPAWYAAGLIAVGGHIKDSGRY